METSEAVSNYRVDDAIVWGHVSDPSRVINQKAPTRDPESINTRNDRYYLYPGDFARNHYSVLAWTGLLIYNIERQRLHKDINMYVLPL